MVSCAVIMVNHMKPGHAKKVVKVSDDWGKRCLPSLRSAHRTHKSSEAEVWSAQVQRGLYPVDAFKSP